MKNVLTYLIILIPWFFSSILFNSDINYYNSLKLPFFAPSSIIFSTVWTILYLLISYTTYKIYSEYNKSKDAINYYRILIINYIFNQLFTFFFFTLRSTFLGFVDSIIVFITSVWLYYEAKNLNKDASKYLIPYIIWSLFATILSLTIYFINL